MEQLIILAVVSLFVGLYLGWKVREVVAARRVAQLVQEYEQTTKEVINESVVPVTIEKHSGNYYVYQADGKFIAQAETRELLEDALIEKFPGKYFSVTPENLKEVGFK